MRTSFRFIGLLAGVAVVVLFSSWGFLVHRTVNQLAVYQLPKSIQPFFYQHMTYVVKNAPRPDERRNTDPAEAPKHFIDAEMYDNDSALWKMPTSWKAAVDRYTKDTLEKYGYVPYWVMEMKERLTRAFREQNKDSILFCATDLGHYIGDAHVPLHTTVNYDGQLTGQKGLHSLWESSVPEIELSHYQLYSGHKAKYLKDPEAAIWNAVRSAYVLLPGVFKQEQEVSKEFADSAKYRVQVRNGRESKSYTSSFAKAYNQQLGKTINQQLLSSANLIADFWYTCWVDAGRPNLNDLLQHPFGKEQKSKLKKEVKAYKKNQLLQKNLLIAKQKQEKKD